MTKVQVESILEDASNIPTIEWIYFEGGEPFLFYPILLDSVKNAKDRGYKVGIVTNAYFGTSVKDALIWLGPLKDLEIDDLSISDDGFHGGDDETLYARNAITAARQLELPVGSICIEAPITSDSIVNEGKKGQPIVGGDVKFRGRAVETLDNDLPRQSFEKFTDCPYEDFENPGRIHIDGFGNTQLCQGISMGNVLERPLSQLMKDYDINQHPICKAIQNGGPKLLAEEFDVGHEKGYIDACHFCYDTRKKLLSRFPEYLLPRQVYGL